MENKKILEQNTGAMQVLGSAERGRFRMFRLSSFFLPLYDRFTGEPSSRKLLFSFDISHTFQLQIN